MDRLAEQLVAVVEETMQPSQVWLWLRMEPMTEPMPKGTAMRMEGGR